MTKYFDASNNGEVQVSTVFTTMVGSDLTIDTTLMESEKYDNVTLIIRDDVDYGDVFIAWDNDREHDKCIFFGKAGHEFNN